MQHNISLRLWTTVCEITRTLVQLQGSPRRLLRCFVLLPRKWQEKFANAVSAGSITGHNVAVAMFQGNAVFDSKFLGEFSRSIRRDRFIL